MRVFGRSFGCVAGLLVVAGGAACEPGAGDVESQDLEVVYGTDNRVQIPDASTAVQGAAAAVAVVLDDSEIAGCAGSDCTIELTTYDSWFGGPGLCSDEPFNEEYTAGFCTAFLVDDDLVATAGHCITANTCSSTAFVFDFKTPETDAVDPGVGNSGTLDVPSSDVYYCDSVVKRQYTATRADYAVIRLDRPVTGRTPLCFRRTGKAATGTSVGVIGSPYGLPLKYAGGATVKSSSQYALSSNLDTYGGNSGSPVVDSSMMVQGIVVRGNTDYTYDAGDQCYRSAVCSDANGCGGRFEDATHTKFLKSWVPSGTCYTP